MNDLIIPAILPKDEEDFSKKLALVPKEIELIHVDVLDEDIFTEIKTPFEAHIMSKDIDDRAELWASRGANKVIVHKLNERIFNLKNRVEIGLAVELDVPLAKVFPYVPMIDFLHLMSIAKIGKQGYPFDERIFDRIKSVKKKFPQVVISLDGGIKVENWERVKTSGADRFIVGSGFNELWNSLTKK